VAYFAKMPIPEKSPIDKSRCHVRAIIDSRYFFFPGILCSIVWDAIGKNING